MYARLKAEKYLAFVREKLIRIYLYKYLDCQAFILITKNILARSKIMKDVKLMNKKDHFFSRIHIDDIGILLFEVII